MLGVDKLGWLMPERTNAVVESGALGCWFVDWMKGAGCVDRVVWWVADERNDVPGGEGEAGVGRAAEGFEEMMLVEARVGRAAGGFEELMLVEAGVGKVAGRFEEMMLVEAGVGKAAGRFDELMLVDAVVGEVARLLVEGMVLALLATIEMKTEDQ